MAWLDNSWLDQGSAPAGAQAAPQQQTTQPPVSAAPKSVPMMTPDGSAVKMVPQEHAQDYVAAGGKQVTKLMSPEGKLKWVPNEQVQDYMAAGGIDPEHPKGMAPADNMRPMGMGEALGIVSAKDVDNYKNNPYRIRSDEDVNNAAIMQPKPGTTGMTKGLGIPVLNTKDYEYKPGVSQDTKDALRHSDNVQKSAAKVMAGGALAGTGALGANALLAPSVIPVAGGAGFGGAAATETLGPSLAAKFGQWVLQNPWKALAMANIPTTTAAGWKWLHK